MKCTQKNKNGLLPCPFCNNKDVRTIVCVGAGMKHNMLLCDLCGVTVSFHDSPQYLQTIKAWNRR